MKIKTVMIDNNGEPLVINASDFRRGSDKLWIEKAVAEAGQGEDLSDEKEVAEVSPWSQDDTQTEENKVKVTHKGGGRWVVTVNGEQVHEGTLTKEEAQVLAEEY